MWRRLSRAMAADAMQIEGEKKTMKWTRIGIAAGDERQLQIARRHSKYGGMENAEEACG